MGFGRPMTPPVSEGEEIDVTIEAVGEKGDGIAKKDGFVIFIPGTRSGETKRIRITRVLKSVGFGEVIGDAKGAPAASAPALKPAKAPEFDPQPELDSEDFGDESAEAPAEKSAEKTTEAPAAEADEEPAAEEAGDAESEEKK